MELCSQQGDGPQGDAVRIIPLWGELVKSLVCPVGVASLGVSGKNPLTIMLLGHWDRTKLCVCECGGRNGRKGGKRERN